MDDTETWQRIYDAIDQRRLAFGWSKNRLYRESNVSEPTLSAMRRGQPLRREDKRRSLTAALGWAPDALDRLAAGAHPDSVVTADGPRSLVAEPAAEGGATELAALAGSLTAEQRARVIGYIEGLLAES